MITNLSKEYRSVLNHFLEGGGEAALEDAYLLGRQALDQGISVLDIAAVHHQVLVTLMRRPDEPVSEETQLVRQARKFLVECLSPFEMAQRGFRESITTLNALNTRLEDEVEQRTQEMRASEALYRSLIEISPDAITMTDLNGIVLVCNHQSALLHGYTSSDDMVGQTLSRSVIPEDMPKVVELSEKIIREGIIGDIEYTLLQKDGGHIPVEVRITLVRDAEGRPSGFLGVNRDISERKKAQRKLESQERRQAALADLGLLALSGLDATTLMQRAIQIVSQTLEVEYCELLELLPEKDGLLLREGFGWKDGVVGNITVALGEGSHAGYTLLKSQPVIIADLAREQRFNPPPSLLEHNIIAGMTVIIYSKGQPYGVLGIYTAQPRQFMLDDAHFLQSVANILAMAIDNRIFLETESQARTRAEADKERALKSLAFVSHELRTPLTSIKGFASTLLADDVTWSPEQQRDFIETINDEANKLNGFIDQLLDMSKMDAGVFNFSITRHPVDDMLMMAMTHLQTLSERHNLTIHIPEQLPEVLTDVQCFEQVLTNLVENAAKYAPPATGISISAQPVKGFVEFTVADEGPGIPLGEREKVFQPFYRTGDKTTQKAKGAGLGLTICRRLIEGQGGHIWVDGKAEAGTVIHFTLPLADGARKKEQDG